jgi:hypothetical protein
VPKCQEQALEGQAMQDRVARLRLRLANMDRKLSKRLLRLCATRRPRRALELTLPPS